MASSARRLVGREILMHDDANPADCVVVWGCLARPGSADFGMTLVAADPRAREAGPVDLPDAAPRVQQSSRESNL
jgi:hypothetical protein